MVVMPSGADLLGQSRLGLRHAVLHQLLRLVGIGAEPERDGERHQAVGGRLAAHIEHVLDAVDLLLDRRRHRLGDHLRIGAGILRAHHHGRRRHLRIFGDRQRRQRQQTRQEDQRRQHAGEDRPVDEESGEVHGTVSSYPELRSATVPARPTAIDLADSVLLFREVLAALAAGHRDQIASAAPPRLRHWRTSIATISGATSAPGRTRCKPLTTMRSPAFRPPVTTRRPSTETPSADFAVFRLVCPCRRP